MPKPTLVIGNKNYSSWSLRPWLVLSQLGVDFEEIRISLFAENYKEAILHHSAAGKVPVYKEGDLLIWDSLAICEYLAEQQPSLWPSCSKVRAVARSISAEMHAGFGALRSVLPMNCRASGRRLAITEEVERDIERIVSIWQSCRENHAGEGSWLFGAFSIADAMYAPVVSRFATYGIECPGLAQEYMASVLADPHVQRWYADAAQESEVIEEEEVGQ